MPLQKVYTKALDHIQSALMPFVGVDSFDKGDPTLQGAVQLKLDSAAARSSTVWALAIVSEHCFSPEASASADACIAASVFCCQTIISSKFSHDGEKGGIARLQAVQAP